MTATLVWEALYDALRTMRRCHAECVGVNKAARCHTFSQQARLA